MIMVELSTTDRVKRHMFVDFGIGLLKPTESFQIIASYLSLHNMCTILKILSYMNYKHLVNIKNNLKTNRIHELRPDV